MTVLGKLTVAVRARIDHFELRTLFMAQARVGSSRPAL